MKYETMSGQRTGRALLVLICAAAVALAGCSAEEPRPTPSDMAHGDMGSEPRDMGSDDGSTPPDMAPGDTGGPVDGGGDGGDMTGGGDAGSVDMADGGIGEPDLGMAGPWGRPSCDMVGNAAVTFSLDRGKTLAPTMGRLQGASYTAGLVVLGARPGVLLAMHNNQLRRSDDHGCTWRVVGEVDGPFKSGLIRLVAAPGTGETLAYGFEDNGDHVVRIDGDTIVELTPPTDGVIGLGVDPNDPLHVRLADKDGLLHDSTDGGASWQKQGSAPSGVTAGLVYRGAFDPNDLDHALLGSAVSGGWVTTDGGQNWTQSTGLSASGKTDQVNLFNAVISPVDGQVVWAMALDMEQSDGGHPSQGRHIFRSTDGGKTFTTAYDATAEVTLVNGPTMAAHGTDPEVLVWIFGTYYQMHGTDIYWLDAVDGLTESNHPTIQEMSTVAFVPGDPNLMYLGLSKDR